MPVFINNVDDYLGPSQACVNPLFTAPPKSTQLPKENAKLVNVEENIVHSSATEHEKTNVAAENNIGIPKKVLQNRRRARQRRVPRIVQSEESNSPAPNTGGAIRLALASSDTKEEENNPNDPGINKNNTTQKIKKKATVTLSDCLSCSGCVTSAEAVLLSEHSVDKLREVASNNTSDQQKHQKQIVFSISSASLADLYRHLYLESSAKNTSVVVEANDENKSLSRHDFLAKIAAFLHSEFGAVMLVDGALSQKISLMESASEFCYRYRKKISSKQEDDMKGDSLASSLKTQQYTTPPMPSVALSSTKTRYINKQSDGNGTIMDEDTLMEVTTLSHPPGRVLKEDRKDEKDSTPALKTIMAPPVQPTSLPMLASSCPGFVCLVEKTAPQAVNLLSSAKSPMAVAGTLLKTGQEFRGGDDMEFAKSCYHVAIMPCHDKKLEAGRGDFAWEEQALLKYGKSSKLVNENNGGIIPVDGVNNNESEDLINEVDLVLTTVELLEIFSDAAAKQEQENMDDPTFTARNLPNDSENGSPTAYDVRTLLARNGIKHGSCALKTAERSNPLAENTRMGALELDTGVHGSGSYADFIFRYAAQDLFGFAIPPDNPLPWKSSSSTYTATTTAGRTTGVIRRRRQRRQETTDLKEITLYKHSDGSYSCYNNTDIDYSSAPVLRFATAYGFKNVQLILQSLSKTEPLSSKPNGYDYVEIMACPSGCSNGGGQIGANGQRETPRETKERVRKTVSAVPIIHSTSSNKHSSLATTLCGCDTQGLVNKSILQSECFGVSARELLHTHFHVVPKLELSTGATAGVALSDTKW